MVSDAKIKAQKKYDATHTKQVMLKLNKNSDADILRRLDFVENKQGYIKQLIRNDLKNGEGVLPLESIKLLILPVVKKYEIEKLSLFGSYARGEATPLSDVDFLIEGGNYTTFVEYMDIKTSLEEALGKTVDLIAKDALTKKSSKSDKSFNKNIEKELISVYER